MRRFFTLIGTMMLVVLIWTTTTAHAAEAFGCVEINAETAPHFDGDRDEAPDDTQKGVTHHHNGCNGHNIGVPTGLAVVKSLSAGETLLGDFDKRALPSLEPNRALRPPIA